MKGTCETCGRSFKLRNGHVVFHRQQWAFIGDTIQMMWPQPPCLGWAKLPTEVIHEPR